MRILSTIHSWESGWFISVQVTNAPLEEELNWGRARDAITFLANIVVVR